MYTYAREDLDWWAGQLGQKLRNGVFGENITSAGLDISGAVIGETWRLGSAVVQIASVRVPCGTFAGWMGQRGWVKRFARRAGPAHTCVSSKKVWRRRVIPLRFSRGRRTA